MAYFAIYQSSILHLNLILSIPMCILSLIHCAICDDVVISQIPFSDFCHTNSVLFADYIQ